MKAITVIPPDDKNTTGTIQLPYSKSESNRALIINALSEGQCGIQNISDSDDTQLLQNFLNASESTLDCKNAGTVFRFLTAYFCVTAQEKIITGSERMQQRPIGSLVDALRSIGANISYLNNEGFPPIKILPSKLEKSHKLSIDISESSQFASALMMIAPLLKNGLEIELTGTETSMPYINMTAQMMQQAGIDLQRKEKTIFIKKQNYCSTVFNINADWSAAAFIYEIAALSNKSEIYINNISTNSLQGDEVLKTIYKEFGVNTIEEKEGIIIKKNKAKVPDYFSFDFINCPDLALPVAATCSALEIASDLYGLKNLVLKESNRAYAFQREAYKLNIKTDFCDNSKLKILQGTQIKPSVKTISAHNDHRMAMSFAPISLKTQKIILDDSLCVAKSFPKYWESLTALGFKLEQ